MGDTERSAEEREAARLERERRRAARPGEPVDLGNGDHPDLPELDRGDHPALPELDQDDDHLEEHEPEQDGAQPELHGWELDDEGEPEVPLGTRRIARRERAADARKAGRLHVRRRRPLRDEPQFRRRRSLLGWLVGVLAVVPVVVALWFLVELFQPFHGAAHGRVTVTIPGHTAARKVGDLLARRGVVASGFFFDLRALLAGDRGKLRAGTYTLKLNMSYSQALKVLTTPPPAAKVSELTIVEGRTRRQIDSLLNAQHIGSGYFDDTRRSPLLNPSQYGAPPGTDSLEGFLFPSTYQLRDPIRIPALIAAQLKTFRARFATINVGYAAHRRLSPYDVLIIASMVQAEAQARQDFPLIASVIYNRLADHMPLQLDATTRYATGNYSSPLTQSQLNSPSPYNTRVHVGLPPTPIDNPGMEAIRAAAQPASTNFLYFVVKPCGNGQHAFASSYAQFQAEVAQYYSARSRHGGNSPSHC